MKHLYIHVMGCDVYPCIIVYVLVLVGHKTEPNAGGQALETPAPTSPLRPIKAEEHYLQRQLSQSHRAITEDISLLMAEGDKYWYGLKCCTTIIVTILIAILLLVILRWVLYK